MDTILPVTGTRTRAPLAAYLDKLLDDLRPLDAGEVADYIPELAKAPPDGLAIAIATTDGHVYHGGDSNVAFSIQSLSKPFLCGYIRDTLGHEAVLRKVGVEPTGEAFNSIVLDEVRNRPFNPMVNAGAIAIASMVDGPDVADRVATMQRVMSAFAGRRLETDDGIYASEDATGHRNRAIAYLMLNSGMIDRSPEETLELYFKQCALSVTCGDLAIMGATLANRGRNPLTGEQIIAPDSVRDVLSVMMSCGMYDYAGEWSFDVGLPAKSGVSGGVLAVLPGQLALAVWSPRLDKVGNSVRGIAACERISADFGLHLFGQSHDVGSVIRRISYNSSLRSLKTRSAADNAVLAHKGSRVAIVELQGALVFSSVERLLRRVDDLSSCVDTIILDFRRVQIVDTAGMTFLVSLAEAATHPGVELWLTELPEAALSADRLADMRALSDRPNVQLAPTTDAALEHCEEALLAEDRVEFDDARLALGRIDLFAGLSRDDLRQLEQHVDAVQFDAGDRILSIGEDPSVLFVIARGSVSVLLPQDGSGPTRIGSLGPGQVFGEMGVIDGQPRSADVVADCPLLCYALSIAVLHDLEATAPSIPITIYKNLAREFSSRMRKSHAMVTALR